MITVPCTRVLLVQRRGCTLNVYHAPRNGMAVGWRRTDTFLISSHPSQPLNPSDLVLTGSE